MVAVDEPFYLVPYLREVMIRCRPEMVGAAVLHRRAARSRRLPSVLLLMLMMVPPSFWLRLLKWKVLDVASALGIGRTSHHLRDVCRELGIPCRDIESVDGDAFAAHLREQEVDVLLHQTPVILRAPVLSAPALAVINRHMSLLPAYRGAWPVFWQCVNGESTFGVTVHQVDEGVDTGPILAQAAIARRPGERQASIMQRLFERAPDVTCEALRRLRGGEPLPPSERVEASAYRTPAVREIVRYLFRAAAGLHAV